MYNFTPVCFSVYLGIDQKIKQLNLEEDCSLFILEEITNQNLIEPTAETYSIISHLLLFYKYCSTQYDSLVFPVPISDTSCVIKTLMESSSV